VEGVEETSAVAVAAVVDVGVAILAVAAVGVETSAVDVAVEVDVGEAISSHVCRSTLVAPARKPHLMIEK